VNFKRFGLSLFWLGAASIWGADNDAAALLTKAEAAFQHNLENEKLWNWTITETRELRDKSGKTVQAFPVVRSESVIVGEGRRCNAVTFWGDGHPAYLKDAAPEERCQAYNALVTPFQVSALLKSSNAKVVSRDAQAIVIAVSPDRSRQKNPDYGMRCAAAIAATVQLDPATFFPLRIEGRVADSGCDNTFQPVMHETPITRSPMSSNFRKGTSFRVVYALQKDRFENPANGYWITTEQQYDQPISEEYTVVYYWGRQFRIHPVDGRRLVKTITTTAKEFGAGSQLTFK
jgi:hypothetical protein